MANDLIATIQTGRLRVNNTIPENLYVVQKGDFSLYKIARKVYGDGERWKEIYSMNSQKLTHQCLLQEGMVLYV